MDYEFVISVTAARSLSTAQYYSRPLCTTKKELLRAAKSAGLFLTVLFECTTLCCKSAPPKLLHHRISQTPRLQERCPKRCQAIPQAMPEHAVCDHRPHEQHKQTQVPRTASKSSKQHVTSKVLLRMMLNSHKVST